MSEVHEAPFGEFYEEFKAAADGSDPVGHLRVELTCGHCGFGYQWQFAIPHGPPTRGMYFVTACEDCGCAS